MISDVKQIPILCRIYKTIGELLSPVLWGIGVVCAILCCFKSAEGSKSREFCMIFVVICAVLLLVLFFTNKNLEKKVYAYSTYHARVVQKLNLNTLLPLCVMVVVVAFPFYILIVTSLKNPLEANYINFSWWPKEGIDVTSYEELFTYGSVIGVSLLRSVWNSFVYAFFPTLIGVFMSALSAYAFAKLKFPHKDLWFSLLIMTMMMPGCVTLTTSYIMYDWYGWTNSAMPLIVPACFGGAATVMFMREYYMGIPDGLLEAAEIDGSGKWKSFFLIILPLAKPAFLAQFILQFIGKYNDFLGPLIYLNDPNKYTVQIAIDFLNVASQDKALLATAGVFALVPMLIIYIIFQNRIISGIAMSSGIKG